MHDYREMEQLARRLQKFRSFFAEGSNFAASQFELPGLLKELREPGFGEELQAQLKKLGSARLEIDRIDKLDFYGTNGILAGERKRNMDECAEVDGYYANLLDKAQMLYQLLVRLPQQEDLAKELKDILPEDQTSVSPSSVNKVPGGRPSANLRETRDYGESPRLRGADTIGTKAANEDLEAQLKVSYDLRDELNNAQRALNDYIDWYIVFSEELSIICSKVQSELREGQRKDARTDISDMDYWNDIFELLQKIEVKLRGEIPEFLASMEEFHQFKDAIERTLQLVNSVTPKVSKSERDKIISQAFNEMRNATTAENTVSQNCRNGAKKMIKEIDTSIAKIFGSQAGNISKTAVVPAAESSTSITEKFRQFFRKIPQRKSPTDTIRR